MIQRMWPKDNAVGLIAHVAESQHVGNVDCVDIRTRRPAVDEGVVMTVQNHDRTGAENGIHGPCLRSGKTHCEEALPVTPGNGAPGTQLIERSGGQMDELDDGARMHDGRMQSCFGGNERHHGRVSCVGFNLSVIVFRQEVFDAEKLSREHTVKRREAELTLATDEIGEMRGPEAGLVGEKRAGELSAVDAANYLSAEPLVELGKIHLWNFVFELCTPIKQFADCKATMRYLRISGV